MKVTTAVRATSADLEQFEGLLFRTTVLLMPYVEEDFDDVRQLLRIKVWRAYESYDSSRSKMTVKAFVFGCLYNYAKDIRKRRHRGDLFIEDLAPAAADASRPRGASATDRFYAQYLAVSQELAFFDVEDEAPTLPNTLTETERQVIGFLLLDYTATEITRTLGVGPKRLRAIRDRIEEKMEDWRPNTEDSQIAVAA
jgi:DNA-directed RNA polymerase specialized sigma24 family protein